MILQNNSQLSFAVNIPIPITPNLRHNPSMLIDIKDFMPVIVSSTDKDRVHIHGSFSLANQDRDAGERLGDLVSFIHTSQQTCTHAVAEQIAYLAYWKDYPLEFRIGRFGSSIVVMAHFPKQPRFDCVLGVFYDRQELHRGVQKWFDCFCQLVRDHAEIWQIHLIVDRPTYRKLEEPRGPKSDILVELVNEE